MSKAYALERLFREFPGGICVPRIQRGYVQGRNDEKGKEIRANFVPTLVDAVFEEKVLSLDFIYGVAWDNGADGRSLLPLDGQQRLSTVFLLAWLCGKWNREWRFTYKSRRIPKLFVKGLCEHPFDGSAKPSLLIKDSAWFLAVWENDPTVAGMIRMLDALYGTIGSRNSSEADFGHVTFLLHGIDGKSETFDHIFRKMNARGKELSPWENLKAMLDKYVPDAYAKDWRDKIDGDWAKTIWEHVDSDVVKLDNAMEKVVRMAYARCAGSEAQKDSLWDMEMNICGKADDGERNAKVFSPKEVEEFFRIAARYFGYLAQTASRWTADRAANALWGGSSDGGEFWNWLSNVNRASLKDMLRMSFLTEPAEVSDTGRRRRVLLNLLDNTGEVKSDEYKSLLDQGLKFLADGNLNEVKDFHKEQITDEQWKVTFDENEILKIERHPLVWLGSTAFLGKIDPSKMNSALALLECAIEHNGKNLFMDVLGLSGKCDKGLPCGSIKIPKCNREWAEECFSVRRLFLRGGVQSWLGGNHYDVNSGSSPWLNYLSRIWDTVTNGNLKRISTKDYGWLFCVKNERLTDEAIRLIKDKNEINNMALLAGVREASDMLYINWGVLPYNGYMKAHDGDLYFNVKSESWKSEKPECYMRAEDGSYTRYEEPKSTLSERDMPSSS